MDNLALSITSPALNIKELDGKKCALCGIIPKDRSSRIDCDAAKTKGSTPVTYHKECWLEACLNYVSA